MNRLLSVFLRNVLLIFQFTIGLSVFAQANDNGNIWYRIHMNGDIEEVTNATFHQIKSNKELGDFIDFSSAWLPYGGSTLNFFYDKLNEQHREKLILNVDKAIDNMLTKMELVESNNGNQSYIDKSKLYAQSVKYLAEISKGEKILDENKTLFIVAALDRLNKRIDLLQNGHKVDLAVLKSQVDQGTKAFIDLKDSLNQLKEDFANFSKEVNSPATVNEFFKKYSTLLKSDLPNNISQAISLSNKLIDLKKDPIKNKEEIATIEAEINNLKSQNSMSKSEKLTLTTELSSGIHLFGNMAALTGDRKGAQMLHVVASGIGNILTGIYSFESNPLSSLNKISSGILMLGQAGMANSNQNRNFEVLKKLITQLSKKIDSLFVMIDQNFKHTNNLILNSHFTIMKSFAKVHKDIETNRRYLINLTFFANEIRNEIERGNKKQYAHFRSLYNQSFQEYEFRCLNYYLIEKEIPLDEYHSCIFKFLEWSTKASFDPSVTLSNLSGQDWLSIANREIDLTAPENSINVLTKALYQLGFVSNYVEFPNSKIWSTGLNSLKQLVEIYPEKAKSISFHQLLNRNIMSQKQNLDSFRELVFGDNKVFNSLVTDYKNQLSYLESNFYNYLSQKINFEYLAYKNNLIDRQKEILDFYVTEAERVAKKKYAEQENIRKKSRRSSEKHNKLLEFIARPIKIAKYYKQLFEEQNAFFKTALANGYPHDDAQGNIDQFFPERLLVFPCAYKSGYDEKYIPPIVVPKTHFKKLFTEIEKINLARVNLCFDYELDKENNPNGTFAVKIRHMKFLLLYLDSSHQSLTEVEKNHIVSSVSLNLKTIKSESKKYKDHNGKLVKVPRGSTNFHSKNHQSHSSVFFGVHDNTTFASGKNIETKKEVYFDEITYRNLKFSFENMNQFSPVYEDVIKDVSDGYLKTKSLNSVYNSIDLIFDKGDYSFNPNITPVTKRKFNARYIEFKKETVKELLENPNIELSLNRLDGSTKLINSLTQLGFQQIYDNDLIFKSQSVPGYGLSNSESVVDKALKMSNSRIAPNIEIPAIFASSKANAEMFLERIQPYIESYSLKNYPHKDIDNSYNGLLMVLPKN